MNRRTYGALVAAALVLTTTSLSCQKKPSKNTAESSESPQSAASDPPPQEVSVTGDCVTVENPDKNDNGCGALHCAQSVFASQSNPTPTVFTPDDTRHVAIGLRDCLSNQGAAVIVGHGLAGRIDTGGEKPPGPQSTQYIDLSRLSVGDWDDCKNEYHPGSLCSLQPKKMSSLTLLGCFTGNQSGQGDKLLMRVLETTGAQKDRAPTGAVFCGTDNKFYFLKGADWQNEPGSIGKQPSAFIPKLNRFIKIRSSRPYGPEYQEITLDQVQINVTRDPEKQGPSVDKQSPFLSLSNLEAPFEFAGCPIAGTNGYVVLNIKPDHDKAIPDKLVLEILGDGLLRDMAQSSPNVFYRSSPQLIEIFNQLMPP